MAAKMLTEAGEETSASPLHTCLEPPALFLAMRAFPQPYRLYVCPLDSVTSIRRSKLPSLSSGETISCLQERIQACQRTHFCVTDFPPREKEKHGHGGYIESMNTRGEVPGIVGIEIMILSELLLKKV